MPDLYSTITEVDRETQERLADVIEMRFADPRHQEMLKAYLGEIEFPSQSHVLEIGCGTGAVTRFLANWPKVGKIVGVDPSSVFIERARTLSKGIPNVSFQIEDGRALSFTPDSFDVVIVHTTLSHVPRPEQLLVEAFRILKSNSWLAVFDGDYSTATVATGEFDPLEACVQAFRMNFVHDPWIIRRLPQLLNNAGFEILSFRSYGYVESPEAGYMLSWIDRGAEILRNSGRISAETASMLTHEAKRRSNVKTWFGHIAFASGIGVKRV